MIIQWSKQEPHVSSEESVEELKAMLQRGSIPAAKRREWMTEVEQVCVDRNNMYNGLNTEKSWTNMVVAFSRKWGADNVASNLKRDLIVVGSKVMEDEYEENHMFDDFNRDMRIHNNHNDRDRLREDEPHHY